MTQIIGSGTVSIPPLEFGQSRLGLPLHVYQPLNGLSSTLVLAGQHGEEAEGTVLLSRALRSLTTALAVHVILCANPDGAIAGTRGNSAGVDLNRNFPTADWTPEPVKHRWFHDAEQSVVLSPGASSVSEPETKSLVQYIDTHTIKTIITLHGPLACIDDPEQSALGMWLSKETGLPLVPDIGYPTPGSLGTWGKEQGVHIITYELPPNSIWELLPVHVPVLRQLLAVY